MTQRGSTRALIHECLRLFDGRGRIGTIVRYMFKVHGVSGPATRERLRWMVEHGELERPTRGIYQQKAET